MRKEPTRGDKKQGEDSREKEKTGEQRQAKKS